MSHALNAISDLLVAQNQGPCGSPLSPEGSLEPAVERLTKAIAPTSWVGSTAHTCKCEQILHTEISASPQPRLRDSAPPSVPTVQPVTAD